VPARAAKYGSAHNPRMVTRRDPDGAMRDATTRPEGTELWLTVHNEDRMPDDLDRMMGPLVEPVAVFDADHLVWGRSLLHHVMKEELVGRMQYPLPLDGDAPARIGMHVHQCDTTAPSAPDRHAV